MRNWKQQVFAWFQQKALQIIMGIVMVLVLPLLFPF